MWCIYYFLAVHILLYIPKTFFNIIYFVGIGYSITCTFACEFSINFLVVDAYCNCLLGCSSDEEFINTFADVLMNELEMRSQFALMLPSSCITLLVLLKVKFYVFECLKL